MGGLLEPLPRRSPPLFPLGMLATIAALSRPLATNAKLPEKTAAIVNDADNRAWAQDMLGVPVLKRGRGPQATPTKVLTSVRLDADILEFFKAQGSGYPSRINAALRTAVERNLTGRPKATTGKRVAA
jgi:uncharacterized protein (DUF4415 family)